MDKSRLTITNEMASQMGKDAIDAVVQDFGGLKFGKRPPTRREREQSQVAFLSLTTEDTFKLIETYGEDKVNKYFERHMTNRRI